MKLAAAALVALTLMLSNNGLPRRYWQPTAYAATPTAAAKARIRAFGAELLARWNVGAPAEYKAVVSFCGDYGRSATGERIYYCGWRLHDPHTRWRCRVSAITASYMEIAGTNRWVACTGVLAPPKTAAPAA